MKNGFLKPTALKLCLLLLLLLDTPAWAVNYTEDANCQVAYLMDTDEAVALPDASGEGNVGTLLGDGEPDFAIADNPPGGFSTGYYVFDGVDDEVSDGDIVNLRAQAEISVVAWIYHDDLDDDDYIINKADGGFNGFILLRDDDGSGTARTDMYKVNIRETAGQGGTQLAIEGATNSSPNQDWTHVAFTFKATSELSLYVDGAEDANSPADASAMGDSGYTDAQNYEVGIRRGAAEFDGRIDEPATFNRELTLFEVNDIMDNGLAGVAVANPQVIIIS